MLQNAPRQVAQHFGDVLAQRLEGLPVDEQRRAVGAHHRVGQSSAVVQQFHLADDIGGLEDRQQLTLVHQVDQPRDDDVQAVRRVATAEQVFAGHQLAHLTHAGDGKQRLALQVLEQRALPQQHDAM